MSFTALVVGILLVLANGFFVAVEFAFTAARKPTLEEMGNAGNRLARWAVASMNELPMTFAGAQLGVAACSLALGFVIESSLEIAFEDLYHAIGLPEGAIATVSLVTALLIVSFVHNVFGEMAPKNATIAAPEKAALLLAAPFRAYATVLRPIIFSLSWVAGAILRIFGVRTSYAVEVEHSADDIATIVKTIGAGGVIEQSSSTLLTAALRFQSSLVSEVMVPRPDLVALDAETAAITFERTMISTGHSRIPVYEGDLDDVLGFVHAKDLITVDEEALNRPISRDLIRPVPLVPETMPVSPVLEMMRSQGVHLAVTIDEHGSVAGMVTLEDIAEELVGDIRDEHDIRETMEIRRAGRDRYLVAGQTRIDRLGEIGAPIPRGEYETVGGFLMAELGRIPRHGDAVSAEGYEMSVRRMDGRRVREVDLKVQPPQTRVSEQD